MFRLPAPSTANLYIAWLPGGSDGKAPAMQETWVQSLGHEDPVEKEMATHSSTLAWKIPGLEEPGKLQSMGLQRVGHNWATWLDHCPPASLEQFSQLLRYCLWDYKS